MAWGSILAGAGNGSNFGQWASLIGGVSDLIGGGISSNRSSRQAAEAMALQRALASQQMGLANLESSFSQGMRNRLLERTGELGTTLREVLAALGPADGGINTRDEIMTEGSRRAGLYQELVDRAFERAGSQGLAQNIRRGTDLSTIDVERRRALADQYGLTSEKAYNQAYEDALKYISGVQDQVTEQRSAALGEVSGVLGAPIQHELAMLNPSLSAMSSLFGNANSSANAASSAFGARAKDDATGLGTLIEQFRQTTLPNLMQILNGANNGHTMTIPSADDIWLQDVL